MSGFYRGVVGDWFRDAAVAMVTEPEPPEPVEEEAEANPIPVPSDFALSYQAAMIPCGCCDCPGCYDCAPGTDACGCLPDNGFDLSDEVAA